MNTSEQAALARLIREMRAETETLRETDPNAADERERDLVGFERVRAKVEGRTNVMCQWASTRVDPDDPYSAWTSVCQACYRERDWDKTNEDMGPCLERKP